MRMMLLLVVLLVGCDKAEDPAVARDRKIARMIAEDQAKRIPYSAPETGPVPSYQKDDGLDEWIDRDNARLDARDNAEMIAGAVEDAAADTRAAIDAAERRLQERMDEEEEKRQHLEEHERATREGLR